MPVTCWPLPHQRLHRLRRHLGRNGHVKYFHWRQSGHSQNCNWDLRHMAATGTPMNGKAYCRHCRESLNSEWKLVSSHRGKWNQNCQKHFQGTKANDAVIKCVARRAAFQFPLAVLWLADRAPQTSNGKKVLPKNDALGVSSSSVKCNILILSKV